MNSKVLLRNDVLSSSHHKLQDSIRIIVAEGTVRDGKFWKYLTQQISKLFLNDQGTPPEPMSRSRLMSDLFITQSGLMVLLSWTSDIGSKLVNYRHTHTHSGSIWPNDNTRVKNTVLSLKSHGPVSHKRTKHPDQLGIVLQRSCRSGNSSWYFCLCLEILPSR